MEDLIKVFGLGAALCFGAFAAVVGVRVANTPELLTLIVVGGLIIAVLAAGAVVLALIIRLYHVRREQAELRLIIGRTVQAVGASVAAQSGGPATVDPLTLSELRRLSDGDGQGTGQWTPVDRPMIEVQNGK